MPLKPGSLLHNRYQIEAILGEGGMGAVYRALDTSQDNQPVAVKEFRMKYLPTEAEVAERPTIKKDESVVTREKALAQFKREAELLASLDHPNLPKVMDYFSVEQEYYLVMTLIVGNDASALLKSMNGKPLPERAVLVWMRQIMGALHFCHSKGVIHRDIKPANIILTVSGAVYLVDFGIAKLDSQTKETSIGARVITPGFSPPEQYSLGRTDSRSDIYALGATMYAMVTGHEPTEAINRLMGQELTYPSDLVSTMSPALETSIIKAMELQPEDRYQSIYDMQTLLFGGRPPAKTVTKRRTVAKPPRMTGTRQSRPGTAPQRIMADTEVQPSQPPEIKKAGDPQFMEIIRSGSAKEETLSLPKNQQKGLLDSIFGKNVESPPRPSQPSPRYLREVNLGESLQQIIWAPSGKLLAILSIYGIYLYDRETVKTIWKDDFGWSGNSYIAFSHDESLIAAGVGSDVQVWNITKGQMIREFALDPDYPITGMAFTQNGQLLVSGASLTKGYVKLWELQSRREILSLNEENRLVGNVAFSPSGKLIAVGWMGKVHGAKRDGLIKIWDLTSARELSVKTVHGGIIPELCYAPNDKSLAVGSGQSSRLKNLRIFDVSNGNEIFGIDHATVIKRTAFSPNGEFLATVGDDGSVRLWNIPDRSEVLYDTVNQMSEATCVGFSKAYNFLAIGSRSGKLNLYSVWQFSKGR